MLKIFKMSIIKNYLTTKECYGLFKIKFSKVEDINFLGTLMRRYLIKSLMCFYFFN